MSLCKKISPIPQNVKLIACQFKALLCSGDQRMK